MPPEATDTTPQQKAAEESIAVIQAAPEEERQRDLRSEMADARHDFSTPADYNRYITALSGGLAGDPLLPEVAVINSEGVNVADSTSGHISETDAKNSHTAADDARTLKALYALESVRPDFLNKLDTYASDASSNPLEMFVDSGADGNVGDKDIAEYLEDIEANVGSAKADLEGMTAKDAEIYKENLQILKDSGEDAISQGTIADLENQLGITGENRRQQFETIYGAVDSSKPAVTPASQENVENGVIHRYDGNNGGSRGFHWDQNGQLDAFNQTNKDGMLSEYRKTPDGWTVRTKTGNADWTAAEPWNGKAPFLDKDGNFGFYVQDDAHPDDPNKLRKVVYDKNGTLVLAPDDPAAAVDLAGKNPDGSPVAIAGLNRIETLGAGQSSTIGDLPVEYVDGYKQVPGAPADAADPNRKDTHAEYTIAEGTNLTEIARKALRVQPGQPDPANLQAVIDQLAKTNGYADPNMIPANAQLIVPVDLAR
jgi:hypothetical protein